MLETIDALFAFAAAAAIAWILVPVAEALAWRIGAIDRPRERSLHIDADAEALGGGDPGRRLRLGGDLPALGRARRGRS